jgi:hypothetical protein
MDMDRMIVIVVIILILGCIQQRNEIEFSDFNQELECIYPLDTPEELIITSQEEYEKLLEYISEISSCQGFVLPYIDFSENTLLGKRAYGSGCSITFERHVYEDIENKKITYSVTVVEEGCCEMIQMSMNWIIIPKIPSDFIIVFEVDRKQI